MTPAQIALGDAIAEAIRIVSQTFWDEWSARYPNLSETRKWELQNELAGLIEAARLQANPPSADRLVAADPNDTQPGTLFEKLESDGSILIAVDDAGTQPSQDVVTQAEEGISPLFAALMGDRV
jgi:hypothetical protein